MQENMILIKKLLILNQNYKPNFYEQSNSKKNRS